MEVLTQALPGVLVSAASLLIGFIAGKVLQKGKELKKKDEQLTKIIEEQDQWREEHTVLMESQRNQIKNSIVRICDEALEKGYITRIALEALHRLYESYVKLGGNSYIQTLVEHVESLPVRTHGLAFEEHITIENVAAIG